MIPPVASDPDPTTQVPWPSTRGRGQETGPGGEEGGLAVPGTRKARSKSPPGRHQLSTWDLVTLSVSMAGAQIAWTVELGCVQCSRSLRQSEPIDLRIVTGRPSCWSSVFQRNSPLWSGWLALSVVWSRNQSSVSPLRSLYASGLSD